MAKERMISFIIRCPKAPSKKSSRKCMDCSRYKGMLILPNNDLRIRCEDE
jgi:hypothetical protein